MGEELSGLYLRQIEVEGLRVLIEAKVEGKSQVDRT